MTGEGWGAESLWQAVEPRLAATLPGFSMEVLPEIDSTNTELMRRARAGRTEPVLLVAERQTAGRGRLGRVWVSDARACVGAAPQVAAEPALAGLAITDPHALPALTFSLSLPLARDDWSGLSLAVGVALVQALRRSLPGDAATDLGLKWPNDLCHRGRKLAGILIESCGVDPHQARQAIVGVGVNLDAPQLPPQALLPGSLPPMGLRSLWPEASAPRVLALLVPALIDALLRFRESGFASFLPDYATVDALCGQAVTLEPAVQGQSHGVALGPDATGALRVLTAAGELTVGSGEVRVRAKSAGMATAAQASVG